MHTCVAAARVCFVLRGNQIFPRWQLLILFDSCAESAYVSIYVYIRGYVWIYVEMAPKTWMHTCVGARVLILCAREPLLSVQMSVLMHFSVQMRVLVFCLTCAMHLLLQY